MSESKSNYHDYYIKRGAFYRTSNEPEKGYKKVEYERDGETKTTYHKLFEAVSGELVGMHIVDGKFGEQIKIFLEEEKDEVNVISIPLYNKYGDINGFADSLARHVGNLKKGEWYTFEPNTERLDKNDNPYMGLVISDKDDEEIRWTISNNDVPAIEVHENRLKKKIYNAEKRNDFLIALLLKSVKVKGGNSQKSGNKPEEKSEGKKPEPATADAMVGYKMGDDLPF